MKKLIFLLLLLPCLVKAQTAPLTGPIQNTLYKDALSHYYLYSGATALGQLFTGGGGGGTVTTISGVNTNGFTWSIANPTTTPALTLTLQNASASQPGQLLAADWSTFNGKQGAITLTTTGSSGAATFSANTLNIPQYAGATYTNGYGILLSTGTFSADTASSGGLVSKGRLATNLGGYQKTITLTTTGTGGAATFSGNTLNIPNYANTTYTAGTGLTLTGTAFSVNASQSISTLSNLTSNGIIKTSGGTGALSIATAGTDYQAPITLTTTGSSGAATFSGNTLNIPQYSGGGGGATYVSGETPSGSINSSNTSFTLANTPVSGSVSLYLNGVQQVPTTDYTISGSTITFVTAPFTGDYLKAIYEH